MATIYADTTATGANDGSSWADAYTTLQTAVDALTEGDTLYANAPEGTPFRPALRSAMPDDVTIYTSRGSNGETWINNLYTASWTDAGGGVWSLALAEAGRRRTWSSSGTPSRPT